MSTTETQKKFMKEIGKCVADLIKAKQNDPAYVIDEDIYDLLKKLIKCKDLITKYKDKAQRKLDEILNCTNLMTSDQQRFARKAKKDNDYSEKPVKRKRKASQQLKESEEDCDDPDAEVDDQEATEPQEEVEEDESAD